MAHPTILPLSLRGAGPLPTNGGPQLSPLGSGHTANFLFSSSSVTRQRWLCIPVTPAIGLSQAARRGRRAERLAQQAENSDYNPKMRRLSGFSSRPRHGPAPLQLPHRHQSRPAASRGAPYHTHAPRHRDYYKSASPRSCHGRRHCACPPAHW
jgi:hypothetical protein